MKMRLVPLLLVLLLPVAARSEAKSPKKVVDSYLCPLYSIGDYPPDALYYCDWMTPECVWQDVSYYFGQLSTVPYEMCYRDCAPVYLSEPKPFPGLSGKVLKTYMPTQPMSAAKPIPESSSSQVKLYINKTRNSHFIAFEGGRAAKVIEYRIYRPISGKCKDCDDKKADKTKEFVWESKFVAFELSDKPAESEITEEVEIRDVLPGVCVKRAMIKYETGTDDTLPVLILLARPAEGKK